eukprot:3089910-Rhodomonas_salina.1
MLRGEASAQQVPHCTLAQYSTLPSQRIARGHTYPAAQYRTPQEWRAPHSAYTLKLLPQNRLASTLSTQNPPFCV